MKFYEGQIRDVFRRMLQRPTPAKKVGLLKPTVTSSIPNESLMKDIKRLSKRYGR